MVAAVDDWLEFIFRSCCAHLLLDLLGPLLLIFAFSSIR